MRNDVTCPHFPLLWQIVSTFLIAPFARRMKGLNVPARLGVMSEFQAMSVVGRLSNLIFLPTILVDYGVRGRHS
jgi:hypothetical protein